MFAYGRREREGGRAGIAVWPMGWINEIVGICMAAHFNWALDEDGERGRKKKKKWERRGQGKQNGWNTHTQTHRMLPVKASRLQLPSNNLQLTFLLNTGESVSSLGESECVRLCICASIFLLTFVCVRVWALCSLPHSHASAFTQTKINFNYSHSPRRPLPPLIRTHASLIEIQNTENTHFHFISSVLLSSGHSAEQLDRHESSTSTKYFNTFFFFFLPTFNTYIIQFGVLFVFFQTSTYWLWWFGSLLSAMSVDKQHIYHVLFVHYIYKWFLTLADVTALGRCCLVSLGEAAVGLNIIIQVLRQQYWSSGASPLQG